MEERVTADLAGWFTFYNGCQTIEAGVKEGKNVFQMHHLAGDPRLRTLPTGLAAVQKLRFFADMND